MVVCGVKVSTVPVLTDRRCWAGEKCDSTGGKKKGAHERLKVKNFGGDVQGRAVKLCR